MTYLHCIALSFAISRLGNDYENSESHLCHSSRKACACCLQIVIVAVSVEELETRLNEINDVDMGSELTHNERRYIKDGEALADIFNKNKEQKAVLNAIVKKPEKKMSRFPGGVYPSTLYNAWKTYKEELGKRENNEGVFARVWKKQQRRHERREVRRG